jgi:hypothetical protein
MPFTVSHVVAVLPLTSGRAGRVFVPAALVIGSMVPDLPYFVPPHRGAEWSHSALGPVTTDLALGLALFALWRLVLVHPLTDLAPPWLRTRLPEPATLGRESWWSVALSVVVGSTTHVLWDTFTHRDRWGTRNLGWLTLDAGVLPVFKWLQYGSGVVGLLVLLVWVWHRLRTTLPSLRPEPLVSARARTCAWIACATLLTGSFAATWLAGRRRTGLWLDEAVLVQVATRTITVGLAAGLILCVGWQWYRIRQRGRP